MTLVIYHIDEDIDHMYEEFKRRNILLWCYAVTEKNKVECSNDRSKIQKRPSVADNSAGEKPKSKRDVCMNKIQEVEEIVEKLISKHLSTMSGTMHGPTCFIQGNIHHSTA